MATNIRTINFLPEIFRTPANEQFLSSTLDQLTQNPKLKSTQGYIGRRVGPGVNPADSYVVEPTKVRSDYQLEPGVIFLKPDSDVVESALTYPGLVDSVNIQGGETTRQDRLWNSEFYAFDPFIDYDKFVNFSQYYWLPSGPDSVVVAPTYIPETNTFIFDRTTRGYDVDILPGINPTITLVRGGSYEFDVNQAGFKFWIQASPGTSGTMPGSSNQSSRDVLGVSNNGEDLGTITFNVPQKNAQSFYTNLGDSGNVDLASSTVQFDEINNRNYNDFIQEYPTGIDGITDLNNRTVIFLTTEGWNYESQYDPTGESYDSLPYALSAPVTPMSTQYSVWRISFVYYDNNYDEPFIQLSPVREVDKLTSVLVKNGADYAGLSFYKTAEGYFERVPLITADRDYLYYQDGTNEEFFGIIQLIDQPTGQKIDIDADILGHKTYTSPNGVKFTNGLKVQFEGQVTPASYRGLEYYVEGVGSGIKLVPVSRLVTPETYTESQSLPYDTTPYDVGNYDATLNAPEIPDYLTINRSSFDYNAWSRCNRWFHIDVIFATAQYNGFTPILNNEFRAKRPIIEFEADLKLFNYGTLGIEPVNIIDFRTTDAMSNINGSTGYSIDGYNLSIGTRIIFAADVDPAVRNKVYEVNFIKPTGGGTAVIDLQPADLDKVGSLVNESVVCLSGNTLQGKSFWFDGVEWQPAQQKTSTNQAPLFDVFDANGVSYSDRLVYASTTFTGSKLFSYATGSGVTDSVIEQPLKYQTVNNVGDIVFDNNLYTDTFIYIANNVSVQENISNGVVRKYLTRTDYTQLLGWQTAHTQIVSRQQFSFVYNGNSVVLDVPVTENNNDVPVKVYVDSEFLLPSNYSYVVADGKTTITFNTSIEVNSIIEVLAVSDVPSATAFYTVPFNLENNPFNESVTELTLGAIRNHYSTICQNIEDFTGYINGANNSRDLGNIVPYGELILQQSSPLTFAGTFMRTNQWDFTRAIDFAAFEYEKFKNVLLQTVTEIDIGNMTTAEILDTCIELVNVGKTQNSPFYWSDMLPSGGDYSSTTYVFSLISGYKFDTLYTYNFEEANYQGILVYVNDVLLLGDKHEYTVAQDAPYITINIPLQVGDVITIREYQNTYANFVPNTPTKLGMYPAFVPSMFYDTTYVDPTWVIRGHDGSLTVAFGDIRDDVLIEFEKRIYDNLKGEHSLRPVTGVDVIPGQFRTTEYTQSEITDMLGKNFLSWVGVNKLPYREQDFDVNNQWTWNYSASQDKLSGLPLLGNWRGIYEYFYDTTYPHMFPWEMLGISEKPSWWELEYGPAPYTSTNLVLWGDLEQGLVKDPAGPYIKPQYARPGLTSVIPVDTEGNLLPPLQTVVGNYDVSSWKKSWVVGDDGPVESAWRKSSVWPFMVQKLLAITKPAKFFALNADLDSYKYNTEFNQFLYNNRYRLDPNVIELYGNGTSKNSYIDWIIDYSRQSGLNSTDQLTTRLRNLDVRLCYRMASFSDKQYLKFFTEKSTPDSLNTSLLIPDESYQLLLYQNPTLSSLTWSSIIIQRTTNGWAVYGYSTANPYFEIYKSLLNGSYETISVAGIDVRVPKEHSTQVVQVPYGYEFTSIATVVDFILSYGAFQEAQGLTFDNVDNTRILNWSQMAQEFVYWTNQGWGVDSLINLNPLADKVKVYREDSVVEPLNSLRIDDVLLNQNKQTIQPQNYIVNRYGNILELTGVNNSTFNYLNARFTAYEHIVVFDNKSIFGDLIYKPVTAARQYRLYMSGFTTYDWNGTLDAQGFILNQDNIQPWVPNVTYTKGQIVLYKDAYWSAAKIIPPMERFEFSLWIKSDYNQIQKGLLPNLATKAELIRNFYDSSSANLERDADLLGFGLIGFRPRRYMENLNLDDISQVNLYKQFLGTKGTRRSAEILTRANLNKEVAEYDIFENWALQRAVYGANAARAFFEVRLNQGELNQDYALLTSNPTTVEIIQPQQKSTADQKVLIGDLWKESYLITSTDILPTLPAKNLDQSLPSAGYVNYDDVAIKSFDFESLSSAIDNYIAEVGAGQLIVGTPIWIAKTNSYDWNVYRTNKVPGRLINMTDNLNGTTTLTFTDHHDLSVGNYIIVREFLPTELNGVYRVSNVASLKSVIVDLSLPQQLITADANGMAFSLGSMRVATASEIVNLPYANTLTTGNQAWVDNIGDGTWAVYKKTNPFDLPAIKILPDDSSQFSKFGTSVAQGFTPQCALVGAPGYESGTGAVYTYGVGDNNELLQTTVISPTVVGLESYGQSIDMGEMSWAVAGAPTSFSDRGAATILYNNSTSDNIGVAQILTDETNDSHYFGYSVAMSPDELWVYIGCPGTNKVNVYNQVIVQIQSVTAIGDGTTYIYDVSDEIYVNTSDTTLGARQITVAINGISKTANVDFTFDGTNVVLGAPPNKGDKVVISRRFGISQLVSSPTTLVDLSDIYTVTTTDSLIVYVDGVLYRPHIDYTYNSITKNLVFASSISSGTVSVSNVSHYTFVDSFTTTGLTVGARFGHAVSCGSDGSQIQVGAPYQTVNGEIEAGSLYYFNRGIERFIVADVTQTTYTTVNSVVGPVTVTLNGTVLVENNGFNNNGQYTFNALSSTVTIETALTVGDIIEIATNDIQLVQTITSQNPLKDADFGWSVDTCPTNCTVYIGAPRDSSVLPAGGQVDRWVNQPRQFGIITSQNNNPIPVLTPGDTLRVNNYAVEVTQQSWTSAVTWNVGSFVVSGGQVYKSIKNVPTGIMLTDTSYWQESNWVESFANDIVQANIDNVSATYSQGAVTIFATNRQSATPFNELLVLPGTGTIFTDLGFNIFVFGQSVRSPNEVTYAAFGASVYAAKNNLTLVVGSPEGEALQPTTFDVNQNLYPTSTGRPTTFDYNTTTFSNPLPNSGVVYTYDYLGTDPRGTIDNIGKFVFGEQLYDAEISRDDMFGTSVSYVGSSLIVGSVPDLDTKSGYIAQFNNPTKSTAWQIIYAEEPIVDVKLINNVYTYDRLKSGRTQYFDFIDPLQGKILGAARENINYLGALDPACYNVGTVNNYGETWTDTHLGEIWWDLSTMRYVEYHQSTLQYSSRRWSQVFPGSSIDVYQWIESDVPPGEYSGPGTVYNTTSYVVTTKLNLNDGMFSTRYFYWVKNIPVVATSAKKTLSTVAIAQYIENPRSSGLPYLAALKPNAFALYNANPYIVASDTIIHIDFDRIANDNNIHVEYDLIASGRPSAFISSGPYRKLLDSFCGEDSLGNQVPDLSLNVADRYGVQFRPRQSMFVDRFLALKNYLVAANNIMSLYPIADSKIYPLLESSEPEPTSTSGQWDQRLANYQELTYQDLNPLPVGYKYLIASDETQEGLWTIYSVQIDDFYQKVPMLSRVQTYDTRKYWSYKTWVKAGYNNNLKPNLEVALYSDLLTLNVPNGTTARVARNSYGKYEIYQLVSGTWERVVLEDGTIAINQEIWDYSAGGFGFDVEVFDIQRYDQAPIAETRQILKALNEEIFIDELAIYRNQLLTLMFEFILTEQPAPEWVFKTSLIDVDHKIRQLLPYRIYLKDNQDFVLDYIKEVKPYHVQIREFNLRYDGSDTYLGTLTDFDVPAEYNTTYLQFVSPVLDNSEYPLDPATARPSNWSGWQQLPYNQWFQNYTLSFEDVQVIDNGSGYTVPPTITVTGECVTPAELIATINTAGQVVKINIVNPGVGYITTPVITITGGNGVGARASAVMGNGMVRSILTTIKYDRFEYTSQVVNWEENINYTQGQYIRYNNVVYSTNSLINSGTQFDPADYTVIDPATLSAADRVMGLYNPNVNEPGIELALVINGIDYPGVQVYGMPFRCSPGFALSNFEDNEKNKVNIFDIGGFDVYPYENLDYLADGRPTFDKNILDTIYESQFADTYLGTRATDVNVVGGEFIDTYSSHAPEELIPGSTFDTLDYRVYTRPGSDWAGDGYGFSITSENFEYQSATPVSFAELTEVPFSIALSNVTNGLVLVPNVDYEINWADQSVTILPTSPRAFVGNIIEVTAYGLGGGSQLFKQSYLGGDLANGSSLIIPVPLNDIYQTVVVINGSVVTNYTPISFDDYRTNLVFSTSYTNVDRITVGVLGFETPQHSYSFPITEFFTYTGSTTFTITQSLQGTNPVNLVVERNGERLRPAESVEYIGDGTMVEFALPTSGKTPQQLIADNQVIVYVDNTRNYLSVDFTVSPASGSSGRYIEFINAPEVGAKIIVAVTTSAGYYLTGSNSLTLIATPAFGATIAVTTWNDTSQQDILTQVFQGPTTQGVLVSEGYNETPYDEANVSNTSGSYDYSTGVVVYTNNFDIGRTITNPERMIVTVNGLRLFFGEDFILEDSTTLPQSIIVISGPILNSGDTLAVTSFTQTVVPDAIAFRVFQDMLGNQTLYRITPDTTTELVQNLSASADIIYVKDASHLAEPNLNSNIFGVVTINGERITYRNRDLIANTVSGLRRGVAGTAADNHEVGALVYDIGRSQALASEYQPAVKSNTFVGDGVTTTYLTDIAVDDTSATSEFVVRVAVGGTLLQYDNPASFAGTGVSPVQEYVVNSVNPISVTLDQAPSVGTEIVIYTIQAHVMYAQGVGTASNGVPLQEQTTLAAKFIKGQV